MKPTVPDGSGIGPVQNHRPSQMALLPDGLITAFWVLLGVLMTALLLLATLVLVRSGIFSAKKLTDEQTKSLWAFLGVAMGAAVTLLGSLLTEQNNRRTSALTREAGEREQLAREKQQALAQEAEERLITDTVARILELITVDGGYAPRARVAGAIATMMQLRGGTIAVRILGELWKDNAVDSDTAVWLIDRILLQYPTDGRCAAHLAVTTDGQTYQVWSGSFGPGTNLDELITRSERASWTSVDRGTEAEQVVPVGHDQLDIDPVGHQRVDQCGQIGVLGNA